MPLGISFGKHFPNRFPNRVTSARLRRKENGVHHLNESKGGKSLLSNCGKGRQNPVLACDKLRQMLAAVRTCRKIAGLKMFKAFPPLGDASGHAQGHRTAHNLWRWQNFEEDEKRP
jgi:hypothetical protein